MDKKEFIKQRCKMERITEEMFDDIYRVVECNCGMPYCKGYRCLDINDLYNELKKKDEVIEKAIEYIKKTSIGSILEVHCGCEEDYIEPLLQILEDKEVE